MLSGGLIDAESTLDWFLRDCHNATSQYCALARESDKTYEDIKKRVDDFLADLYESPLVVSDAIRPGLIKSGMVRKGFFNVIQSTSTWSTFAAQLDSAMQGNGTELRNRLARPIPGPSPKQDQYGHVDIGQADLALLAVSCADSPPYDEGEPWPTAEEGIEALQGILRDVSPRFGATVNLMEQHGGCQVSLSLTDRSLSLSLMIPIQFWPKSEHPVERFTVK